MRILNLLELRTLARMAAVGLLGALAAGCSQEMSRFSANPTPPRAIASAGPANDYTAAVPTARIDRQSLTPMGGLPSASLPSASSRSAALPSVPRPINPRPYTAQPVASAPLASASTGSSRPDWRAEGGSRVTVMPGDSVEVFSRRYGVAAATIRQANGLGANGQPAQYAQILIPAQDARSSAESRRPAQTAAAGEYKRPAQMAAAVPAAPKPARGGSHVVTSGETLTGIGRRYEVPVRDIAVANGVSVRHQVRIGQRLTIPGASDTQMAQASEKQGRPAAAKVEPAVLAARAPKPLGQIASAQAESTEEDAAPAADETAAAAPASSGPQPYSGSGLASRPAETASLRPVAYAPPAAARAIVEPDTTKPEPARLSASSFRWPVRGRVISEFGTTEGGQRNDGINLAVPEGSPVKAAENGVVVYAGSELKGYGNLVLIRHEGDFVTAYAHNSELSVKRGDTVRRGQIISKAGQTGNVSSPQVHFEIRKGAKPVDPKDYLSGS